MIETYLKPLDDKLDTLSRRERLIVTLTLLVAVFAAFDFLFVQPAIDERDAVMDNIRRVSGDIGQIRQKIEEVTLSAAKDPNRELRERHKRLKAQLHKLDLDLERYAGSLVPPKQMLPLLRRLLDERADLDIVHIENKPPESVSAETGAGGVKLYRHVLTVEFTGGYLETLNFLHAIEALPWRIFWESLDYRVENYPTARVRLNIATLSLQEDWIGV